MTSIDQEAVADAPAPRAWLVRHGETEWSRSGRHTSRTDLPLTETGRREGELVGGALGGRTFGLVLSSPMKRALDTARLAGYGSLVEVDADLKEWDYGTLEGQTTADIRASIPDWSVWTNEMPGGETAQQVAERADRVVQRIRANDADALVFGHKHILRVLAARWLGLPVAEGRWLALDTATISILGWEREDPVIERWNAPCDGRPVGG